MSSMKTKKKRPTTNIIFEKNMKAALSERLKIAGIKELKPQYDKKQSRNSNKSLKKRKDYKTSVEKHRNKLPKNLDNKQALNSKKTFSRKSSNSLLNSSDKKKGADETLNVSLEFIKDCQKYKRKFMNPKDDLRLSNQKICSTSSKPSVRANSASGKSEEKEKGNSSKNDCLVNENKSGKLNKKKTIDDELKSFAENLTKTYYTLFLNNKQSVSDVAKIDKKYLESVLSLTNQQKPNKKSDTEKSDPEKGKTKPTTGRNNHNNEAKNKDQDVNNEKDENKNDETENSQNNVKQEQRNHIYPRTVRDSTKSEVRFQLRFKKAIGNQRNSEELKTEKEVTQSKCELKKRKHRNKILKSNNKELIEIPFSSEISQTKDVKEIWRRETQKISENSLTSNSSSTIPEIDESSKWKNCGLQSYRILHKLVEEEINKISKNSESKNNTKEVKNKENNTQKVHESTPEQVKGNLKSKNINTLKLHSINEKETLYTKKKLLHIENLHAEGEKDKNQLLSILNDDSAKIPTEELKIPEAKKTKGSKFPEQAVDNWCILNRLEQAFLALGTLNFKDDSPSKTYEQPKNNFSQNSKPSENSSNDPEEEKIKYKLQATNDYLNRKDTYTEIKKIQEPKVRIRLNNNEWIFPRRKNDDEKFFPSNVPAKSREKSKRSDRKSSYSLDQAETRELSQRKKTCNENSTTKTSTTFPNNTKVRTKSRAKEKPKALGKDIAKKKSLSCHQVTEKKEEPKNIFKPPTENTNEGYKSGIPKLRAGHKVKNERADTFEERSKNQTFEKKDTNQRVSIERPVKERSILSVHGTQKENHPSKEKFNRLQHNTNSSIAAALKSNTADMIMKHAEKNLEGLYGKSTSQLKSNNSVNSLIRTDLYDQTLTSSSESDNKPESSKKSPNCSKQSVSPDNQGEFFLIPSLSETNTLYDHPIDNEKLGEVEKSRNLSLWERDIRRYREIVNDIMSQYKRIDGFLKHSKRLGTSSKEIDSDLSSQKNIKGEQPGNFNSLEINLSEYRKKIITEYQALPFFEYKELDKKKNLDSENSRKRNLTVVTNFDKEKDFDVKDYQPKITKVLDSQLYVDNSTKQITENTPKDKKFSLQEILLARDKDVFQQHCLKTYSLPKALQLPEGEICSVSFSDQNQKF